MLSLRIFLLVMLFILPTLQTDNIYRIYKGKNKKVDEGELLKIAEDFTKPKSSKDVFLQQSNLSNQNLTKAQKKFLNYMLNYEGISEFLAPEQIANPEAINKLLEASKDEYHPHNHFTNIITKLFSMGKKHDKTEGIALGDLSINTNEKKLKELNPIDESLVDSPRENKPFTESDTKKEDRLIKIDNNEAKNELKKTTNIEHDITPEVSLEHDIQIPVDVADKEGIPFYKDNNQHNIIKHLEFQKEDLSVRHPKETQDIPAISMTIDLTDPDLSKNKEFPTPNEANDEYDLAKKEKVVKDAPYDIDLLEPLEKQTVPPQKEIQETSVVNNQANKSSNKVIPKKYRNGEEHDTKKIIHFKEPLEKEDSVQNFNKEDRVTKEIKPFEDPLLKEIATQNKNVIIFGVEKPFNIKTEISEDQAQTKNGHIQKQDDNIDEVPKEMEHQKLPRNEVKEILSTKFDQDDKEVVQTPKSKFVSENEDNVSSSSGEIYFLQKNIPEVFQRKPAFVVNKSLSDKPDHHTGGYKVKEIPETQKHEERFLEVPNKSHANIGDRHYDLGRSKTLVKHVVENDSEAFMDEDDNSSAISGVFEIDTTSGKLLRRLDDISRHETHKPKFVFENNPNEKSMEIVNERFGGHFEALTSKNSEEDDELLVVPLKKKQKFSSSKTNKKYKSSLDDISQQKNNESNNLNTKLTPNKDLRKINNEIPSVVNISTTISITNSKITTTSEVPTTENNIEQTHTEDRNEHLKENTKTFHKFSAKFASTDHFNADSNKKKNLEKAPLNIKEENLPLDEDKPIVFIDEMKRPEVEVATDIDDNIENSRIQDKKIASRIFLEREKALEEHKKPFGEEKERKVHSQTKKDGERVSQDTIEHKLTVKENNGFVEEEKKPILTSNGEHKLNKIKFGEEREPTQFQTKEDGERASQVVLEHELDYEEQNKSFGGIEKSILSSKDEHNLNKINKDVKSKEFSTKDAIDNLKKSHDSSELLIKIKPHNLKPDEKLEGEATKLASKPYSVKTDFKKPENLSISSEKYTVVLPISQHREKTDDILRTEDMKDINASIVEEFNENLHDVGPTLKTRFYEDADSSEKVFQKEKPKEKVSGRKDRLFFSIEDEKEVVEPTLTARFGESNESVGIEIPKAFIPKDIIKNFSQESEGSSNIGKKEIEDQDLKNALKKSHRIVEDSEKIEVFRESEKSSSEENVYKSKIEEPLDESDKKHQKISRKLKVLRKLLELKNSKSPNPKEISLQEILFNVNKLKKAQKELTSRVEATKFKEQQTKEDLFKAQIKTPEEQVMSRLIQEEVQEDLNSKQPTIEEDVVEDIRPNYDTSTYAAFDEVNPKKTLGISQKQISEPKPEVKLHFASPINRAGTQKFYEKSIKFENENRSNIIETQKKNEEMKYRLSHLDSEEHQNIKEKGHDMEAIFANEKKVKEENRRKLHQILQDLQSEEELQSRKLNHNSKDSINQDDSIDEKNISSGMNNRFPSIGKYVLNQPQKVSVKEEVVNLDQMFDESRNSVHRTQNHDEISPKLKINIPKKQDSNHELIDSKQSIENISQFDRIFEEERTSSGSNEDSMDDIPRTAASHVTRHEIVEPRTKEIDSSKFDLIHKKEKEENVKNPTSKKNRVSLKHKKYYFESPEGVVEVENDSEYDQKIEEQKQKDSDELPRKNNGLKVKGYGFEKPQYILKAKNDSKFDKFFAEKEQKEIESINKKMHSSLYNFDILQEDTGKVEDKLFEEEESFMFPGKQIKPTQIKHRGFIEHPTTGEKENISKFAEVLEDRAQVDIEKRPRKKNEFSKLKNHGFTDYNISGKEESISKLKKFFEERSQEDSEEELPGKKMELPKIKNHEFDRQQTFDKGENLSKFVNIYEEETPSKLIEESDEDSMEVSSGIIERMFEGFSEETKSEEKAINKPKQNLENEEQRYIPPRFRLAKFTRPKSKEDVGNQLHHYRPSYFEVDKMAEVEHKAERELHRRNTNHHKYFEHIPEEEDSHEVKKIKKGRKKLLSSSNKSREGSTNVKRVHAVYDDDKFIFVKDNRDKYQYVFKAKPENLKTTSNKIKIIKDTAVPIFSRSDERDDNLNQHFSPQINIHNRKIKRIPRKKIHHALIVPFPDKHGKAVFKEEENYRGEQKIIKNINEDTFSL